MEALNDRTTLVRVLATIVLSVGALSAGAADLANGTPTTIKDPECIMDPSELFFAQNSGVEPRHPVLPVGHYYEIVRYLGTGAVSSPVETDFGRISEFYPYPPFRGLPLTGFTPPEPRSSFQRARADFSVSDNSSAFQLHCYDSGSYINTWTFPFLNVQGGGAHSIYGFSFDATLEPPVYDSDPGTDFVLQADIEVPWFYSVPDSSAGPDAVPVGQVSIFAYLVDRPTNKIFALLLGVFDNRYTAPGSSYASFVSHDGETPFVSTPIGPVSKYATLSPYSAAFTGNTWSGLRFFRANVTQANFRQAIADINAYCAANPALRYCSGAAFSDSPANYVMTDFGVLHEVFRQTPMGNLSMGVHVYGLGAYNFR